jgi:copper transport protein
LAEQAQAHHARAAAEPPGFFVEIADVGISAFVAVEPAKPGLNRLRLDLADGHDAPLAALGLKLSIANPQLGIEPRERELVPNGAGSYEIADLAFPASGTWTLSIDALVSDFEKRVVTTEIPIR